MNYTKTVCTLIFLLSATTIVLEAATKPSVFLSTVPEQISQNAATKTAETVRGVFAVPANTEPEQSALAFLSQRRELFRLANPAVELKVVANRVDQLGKRHIRYDQLYKGLKVWGCQTIVHFLSDTAIYLVAGQTIPTPTVSVNATLTQSRADIIALVSVAQFLNNQPVKTQGELVIYPMQGTGRLAYLVNICGEVGRPISWKVFVDAQSGEVLHQLDMVCADGPTTGTGTDVFGNARSFHTYQEPGTTRMIDATRSMFQPPIGNRKGVIMTFSNMLLGGSLVSDPNGDNVFTDNPGLKAAVSGQYWIEKSWEYFNTTFGLNSWDNNGITVVVNVHDSSIFDNAYWDYNSITGLSYVTFSDGDGIDYGSFLSPDIIGHEFAHGVTNFSAGLLYQFEPGALNEHMSDFFGARIEGSNYLIGEQTVLKAPFCMRNMQDPHIGFPPNVFPFGAQPAHMSEFVNLPVSADNGGVHFNSGIPNRVGYLVSSSLGWQKAEAIWYRCLTTYLTPNSSFDFWAAMLTTATNDLYPAPSQEVDVVTASLDSVGFMRLSAEPREMTGVAFQVGTVWDSTITIRNRESLPVQITGASLINGVLSLSGPTSASIQIGQDASYTVSLDGTTDFSNCDLGYFRDTLVVTTNSVLQPVLRIPLKVFIGNPPAPKDTAVVQTSCLVWSPNNSLGMQRLYRTTQDVFTLAEPINGRGSFIMGTARNGDTTIYSGWQDERTVNGRTIFPAPSIVPVGSFVRSQAPNGDSLLAIDFITNDGRISGTAQYQWEPLSSAGCDYVAIDYWFRNNCADPLTVLSGMYYEFNYLTDSFFVDASRNMAYALQWPANNPAETAAVGIAMLNGTARNVRLTRRNGGLTATDGYFKPGYAYQEMMLTTSGLHTGFTGDFECLVTFGMDTLYQNQTAHYRGAVLYSELGRHGLQNIFPEINPPPACCVQLTGNVDCDNADNVDIADLTTLVDHLFIGFAPLCCEAEAETDSSSGVDIGDLTFLVDHLFISFPPLRSCP